MRVLAHLRTISGQVPIQDGHVPLRRAPGLFNAYLQGSESSALLRDLKQMGQAHTIEKLWGFAYKPLNIYIYAICNNINNNNKNNNKNHNNNNNYDNSNNNNMYIYIYIT